MQRMQKEARSFTMMRNMFLFLMFMLPILTTGLFAIDEDSRKPGLRNVVIFPVLYYTPETRLGIGVAAHHTYRRTGRDTVEPPNSITGTFVFTQNKQINTRVVAFNTWRHDTYRTLFDAIYSKYPDKFYGIGNDTSLSSEEKYTHVYGSFRGIFLRQIIGNLYAGPDYFFEVSDNRDLSENGLLISGNITGSEGTVDSGLGFMINYDTRNSTFYPTSGGNYLFSAHFFRKSIGSSYNFSGYTLDLRKYSPLFQNHTLAFQTYTNIMTGTVPFHMLSLLGGSERMRGYFLGRYRDNVMFTLQAEYRLPLFWRLGMAVFTGVGDVAERVGDLNPGDFKFSAGAGIRFTVDTRERVNVRLDAAFGRDESGVYFSIFEAF